MSQSSRPVSGPAPPGGPPFPVGPTVEEWSRLTPEERERLVDALIEQSMAAEEALPPAERESMAESEHHLDAVIETRETLRSFFSRTRKDLYIAANLRVYYPGEAEFAPDILVVWGVPQHKRDVFIVAEEGKGLDLALEVIHRGKRSKDLKDNVERYAQLGIREYFVLDLGRQRLLAYRLPTPEARRYEPVLGNQGRYASEVLGLDLMLRGGELRYYYGTAELSRPHEELARLAQDVAAERAQMQQTLAELEQERAKAEQERAKAEQERAKAEQERAKALARLRKAVLALLRVRGLGAGPEVVARIEGCSDLDLLSRWLDRAEERSLDTLFLDD